jgi:hypothetical protein
VPNVSVADRRRVQLDDALRRVVALLAAAEVDERVELSELGLARLVVAGERAGLEVPKDAIALATRLVAQRLATARPGRTVEVRVPPYIAVQVAHGHGPTHTRGTPPSVVETDPLTFLRLATGDLTWAQATATAVRISGVHADLSDVFPFG